MEMIYVGNINSKNFFLCLDISISGVSHETSISDVKIIGENKNVKI